MDEHLAVDADHCRDERWLCAADVLYGTRRRSRAEALRWLDAVTAGSRGCYVAATPVAGGLWAAQCRADGRLLVVTADPRTPVGSCLHGWAVAGGRLDDLESAAHGGAPPMP